MCEACDNHPDTDITAELDKAHPVVKAHFELLRQQRNMLFDISWQPEANIRTMLLGQGAASDEVVDQYLKLIRESGRTDFYDLAKDLYRGAIVNAYFDIQEKIMIKKGWMTPDGSLNYFQMKQDGLDIPAPEDDLSSFDLD